MAKEIYSAIYSSELGFAQAPHRYEIETVEMALAVSCTKMG